jgi:hypothetical protein
MSLGETLGTNDLRQVRVDWESIQRRLDETGWDDLYVLFTPDNPARPGDKGLAAAAEEAMHRATAAVSEDVIFGRSVEPSPYGPVVWIDYLTSEDGLRTWLSTFAASLEAVGWSGLVGAHPQAWFPEWLQHRQRSATRIPTAFLAYRLDVPSPTGTGWAMNLETTGVRWWDAVEWAGFDGGQAYLSTGLSQVLVDRSRSDEILAFAADFAASAGLAFLRKEPFRFARVELSAGGEAVYQLDDEALDWEALAEEITQPLIWHPDALDLAIVRPRPAWVSSWRGIRLPPLPPLVYENQVLANRHLWDRFVPDVHGIQLLTEAHLARAGNLDAWDVQRLTPSRYLVQAKDLRPWFAADEIDPSILAAARQDFHDMLLTPEVIETHRPL